MIDSAQTGARCREKQRRKRFVKAFQWKKQKDSHGCAVRRVWKGCGNGANRGARSVNPQFSDANAGQRGYNRRHFPAGDAARMQGTTPSLQINVADAFSSRDERNAVRKNEQKPEQLKGESIRRTSFKTDRFLFFLLQIFIRFENRLFRAQINFLIFLTTIRSWPVDLSFTLRFSLLSSTSFEIF